MRRSVKDNKDDEHEVECDETFESNSASFSTCGSGPRAWMSSLISRGFWHARRAWLRATLTLARPFAGVCVSDDGHIGQASILNESDSSKCTPEFPL